MNVVPAAPPLPTLLETTSYKRAVAWWGGPQITIVSVDNKAIANIPLNFVTAGGDNTWAYVIGIVKVLVLQKDGLIYNGDEAVNQASAPIAGRFVYSCQGMFRYLLFRSDYGTDSPSTRNLQWNTRRGHPTQHALSRPRLIQVQLLRAALEPPLETR